MFGIHFKDYFNGLLGRQVEITQGTNGDLETSGDFVALRADFLDDLNDADNFEEQRKRHISQPAKGREINQSPNEVDNAVEYTKQS